MNGSDYKKMVENFKASSELKQTTIDATHSRVFKKLKLTKRERMVRYSSAAAMFAMVVVLFLAFNVGESIAIASKTIKGQNSVANGSGVTEVSTELPKEKESQKSTEKATEKLIVKSTEASTEKQTTKVQEVVTTAPNKTTSTTSNVNSYTNVWTNTNNPISITKYNFSGNAGSIEVNSLSVTSMGNLFEAKVGQNENYTVRTEVQPVLFNSGLVITKSSDGIVTFTNDNEGVILRENIVNFPQEASESQSEYASRCITYITGCCTDETKAKSAFSLSDDYVLNVSSFGAITNSDIEWRATMKLNFSGNPIAALSKTTYGGFGYLTIVFDRYSQCFLVQTYVVQNSLTSTMSTASYGVKYKVN